MADITNYLNNIKNAVLGREIRGSIYDGIDMINKEVESTTKEQSDLNDTFRNLVINAGNSNAEVAASRGSYDFLPDRLNKVDEQFISIKSEKATKLEVDVERKRIDNFTTLSQGSTTGDAELIDARVDDLGNIHSNVGNAFRKRISQTNTDLKNNSINKFNELNISVNSPIRTYSIVKSLKNSTFDEITKILTIPKNTNCGDTYLGYRFIVTKDDIGKTLKIKLNFTNTNVITFNDKLKPRVFLNYQDVTSQNYVSGYLDIDGSYNFIITIPQIDGSKNLDVCLHYVYYGTISTEQSISLGDISTEYYGNTQRLEIYLNNRKSNYVGKQLACFGDSYTAQAKWQPYVVSNLNLNGFDSFAQSGGTLTSIYEQIANLNKSANIVTVWIGTNDYNGNRKIGSLLDDVTDESIKDPWGYTTFKGALNYVCKWLSTNMPSKNIVFITPTYRHDTTDDARELKNGKNEKGYILNNAGHSLEDYADAMIEVANHWGYPVLDLFHVSGINELTYNSYYQADRLHPSEEGAVLLAKKISSFINNQ